MCCETVADLFLCRGDVCDVVSGLVACFANKFNSLMGVKIGKIEVLLCFFLIKSGLSP